MANEILIFHSLTHSPEGQLEGIGVAHTPEGEWSEVHTSHVFGFSKIFFLNGVSGAEAQRVLRETEGSPEQKAKALRDAGLEQIKY